MRGIALLGLACLTGCPFGLPPLRTELGEAWSGRGGTFRAAAGADLITVGADTPRVAVGAGGFVEIESKDDEALDTPVHPTKGGYGEVGYEAFRTETARLMVGVRGERRSRDGQVGYGAKLRLDLETFDFGSGAFDFAEGCTTGAGAYYGLAGIGLYAESGPVWSPDQTAWATTVGISLRTPAILGIVIALPCGH
jgi:hypothetical protein